MFILVGIYYFLALIGWLNGFKVRGSVFDNFIWMHLSIRCFLTIISFVQILRSVPSQIFMWLMKIINLKITTLHFWRVIESEFRLRSLLFYLLINVHFGNGLRFWTLAWIICPASILNGWLLWLEQTEVFLFFRTFVIVELRLCSLMIE